MGRGQTTVRDQFSHVFGDRRGSRKRATSGHPVSGKTWVRARWRGAGIKPLSGAAFVFPKRLTDDEQEQIHSHLMERFKVDEIWKCRHLIISGGGSLIHVVKKELIEAPGLQDAADDLCRFTSPETPYGEVRAMIPQTLDVSDVMGRDVMVMRPSVGAE